jgi:deoxycytidine triphosphate deaminase
MIVNPQNLINNSVITFPSSIKIEDYIQPNGIDIDANRIYELEFDSPPIIMNSDSYKPKPKLLAKENIIPLVQGWKLQKGKAYTFESSFNINLPMFLSGEVVGRSTLNRHGVFIRSSWFDSGFKGTIGATIYCFNDIWIQENARIAQVIVRMSETYNNYNGQYQQK